MKALTALLLVLALVPGSVLAQSGRGDSNQEVDSLYPQTKLKKKKARPSTQRVERREIVTKEVIRSEEPTPVLASELASHEVEAVLPVAGTAGTQVTVNSNQSQNAQATASNTIQQQPPSIVEATPLRPSKLDGIKKSREEAERATEERLVEKLEQDRIDSEAARAKAAEKMFEKKEEPKTEAAPAPVVVPPAPVAPVPQTQVVIVPAPVAPAPVVPAAPAVKVEGDAEFKEVDALVDERSSVKEEALLVVPTEEGVPSYYLQAIAGIGDYGSTKNVKGVYAIGAAFGIEFTEGIAVQADFVRSSYDITSTNYYYNSFYHPTTIEMNQNMFSGTVKYLFPTGRIRPVVGLLAAYSKRDFSDRLNPSVSLPSSTAFDGGLVIGGDLRTSARFSVGADIRMIKNLSYRRDQLTAPYQYNYYNGGNALNEKPVEEIGYYVLSVGATFRF